VSQMPVFGTDSDEGWLMAVDMGERTRKPGTLVSDGRGQMRCILEGGSP
jgi:hypothetical protein